MSATCGKTNGIDDVVTACASAFSSRMDAQLLSWALIVFMVLSILLGVDSAGVPRRIQRCSRRKVPRLSARGAKDARR